MSAKCIYCQRRMRANLTGWRPVSLQGRISGWECPTCQKLKDGGIEE